MHASYCPLTGTCRSREGAWIEILDGVKQQVTVGVAPVRERGLKFLLPVHSNQQRYVAPVRERGLKWICSHRKKLSISRSREGAWIEIISAYN